MGRTVRGPEGGLPATDDREDDMDTGMATSWHGTAVALGRVGMGLLGLLAPGVTQRAALLGEDGSAEVRVWTRFWATRALALGVGYLTADARGRAHLIRMGLLVDGVDTAFLLAMAARGRLSRRAASWLTALTASAAAADLAEIRGADGARATSRSRRGAPRGPGAGLVSGCAGRR